MGTISFNDGEYEVTYDKNELQNLRRKILVVSSIINNEDYTPYIVTLIDRLLVDDYEAIREIVSPDMSKEYNKIKLAIDYKAPLLSSERIDVNAKLQIVEDIRQLLISLKNIGSRLGIMMDYYFELASLIKLEKISYQKELI